MAPSFMTVPQAAALLGLAPSTLRRQLRLGRMVGHKIGRDWFVTSGEVRRYELDFKRPARKDTAA